MPTEIFVLKLIVTPLLIAAATLVARRWGPGVGGWLAGFPLTSAPVSVFLALEQGPDFAAGAAVGTLGGVIGSFAFAVFFLIVGALLGRVGIGATYVLASVGALVVNGVALSVSRRMLG